MTLCQSNLCMLQCAGAIFIVDIEVADTLSSEKWSSHCPVES